MATKFFCRNTKCDRYDQEQAFPDVTYVMREGQLVPKQPLYCDHCHEEVEMVKVKEEGPINCNVARFNSLSNDDKKRWIMNRNKQVEKKDKELYKHYEKKILGTNLD